MDKPKLPQRPGEIRVSKGTVYATIALIMAGFVACIALAFAGWKAPEIIGLMSGLLGLGGAVIALLEGLTRVLRINVDQSERLDEQSEKLATVERQTNGEMTARINEAVTAALKAALNGPTVTQPVITNGRKDE